MTNGIASLAPISAAIAELAAEKRAEAQIPKLQLQLWTKQGQDVMMAQRQDGTWVRLGEPGPEAVKVIMWMLKGQRQHAPGKIFENAAWPTQAEIDEWIRTKGAGPEVGPSAEVLGL